MDNNYYTVEKSKLGINPSVVASEKKKTLNLFNVPSTPAILRQDNPYFQETYSSIKKSLFFKRIPDVTDNINNNNNDTVRGKSLQNNLLKFFLKNADDSKTNTFNKPISNNITNNNFNINPNNANNNSSSNNNNVVPANENNDNSMEVEDDTFINYNTSIRNNNTDEEDSEIIKTDEITVLEDNESLEEKFKNLLKQISSLDTLNKDKSFELLLELVENCSLNDIIHNQGYILECIKFGFIEDDQQIVFHSLACLEKIINCKKQLQSKEEIVTIDNNNNNNNNNCTFVHQEIKLDDSIMSRLALILSDFKNNNRIINKTVELIENIFKDNPLEYYLSILLDKALEYDVKIKKILIELVESLILYTYSKEDNSQELNIDKDNKLMINDEKENKTKEKINPYLLILIKKIHEVDAKQRINLILSFINILQSYPLKINLVRFLQIYISFANEIHIRRRLQQFAIILCRDNTIGNPKSITSSVDKPEESEIIKIPNSIILFEAINSLPPSQKKQIKIILNKDIVNFDEVERNQKQLKIKLNILKQKKQPSPHSSFSEDMDESHNIVNEPKSIKQEKPEVVTSMKTVYNSHANKRSKTSLTTSKITHFTRSENTHLNRKKPSIYLQQNKTAELETKILNHNKPKLHNDNTNINTNINTNANTNTNTNINSNNHNDSNKDKNDINAINNNVINYNNSKNNSSNNNNNMQLETTKKTSILKNKRSISKIPELSNKNLSLIKKSIPRPNSSLSMIQKSLESNHLISRIPVSSKEHHITKSTVENINKNVNSINSVESK